jgi:hypothetical protein
MAVGANGKRKVSRRRECGRRWGAQEEALGSATCEGGVPVLQRSTLACCSGYHRSSGVHAIHGRQGTKGTVYEREQDACQW